MWPASQQNKSIHSWMRMGICFLLLQSHSHSLYLSLTSLGEEFQWLSAELWYHSKLVQTPFKLLFIFRLISLRKVWTSLSLPSYGLNITTIILLIADFYRVFVISTIRECWTEPFISSRKIYCSFCFWLFVTSSLFPWQLRLCNHFLSLYVVGLLFLLVYP